MTRVLLALGQPAFRAGLVMLVEADDRAELVGQTSEATALVDLVRSTAAQVLLLDLTLPGLDPQAGVADLVAAGTRVVVMAPYPDDARIDRALIAGAGGFVLRDDAPGQILDALLGQPV